jgi:alkylation response protein AidB-like acyl-CoA dehydrogenase
MVFQFQLGQKHIDYQKSVQEYLERLNLQSDEDIMNNLSYDGYLALPGLENSKAFDYLSLALTMEEVAKFYPKGANAAIELLFAQDVVKNCALEECKEDCVSKIKNLEKRINVLFSEPGHYTAEELATKIEKTDDGYKVSGKKIFVTENTNCDVYLIVGKLIESEGDETKLALAALSKDQIELYTDQFKFGASTFNIISVHFDAVVPAEKIMKKVSNNLERELAVWRTLIAATAIGLAHNNLTGSLSVVKDIKNSQKQSLSTSQAIQFSLADMYAEIEGARMLTYYSAVLIDSDKPSTRYSSMAKVQASEAAVFTANKGTELIGNVGNVFDVSYLEALNLAYSRQIKDGTSRNSHNLIYKEALARR